MTTLLGCGLVGAVLFVSVFLVDGWTRAGYHPTRHAVSALALGSRGWLQTANFHLCGVLFCAAGVGIARADHPLPGTTLVVTGLALVASGVWPMDPMRGYPPGAPEGTPDQVSGANRLHDNAGTVVFVSIPVAAFLAALSLSGAWAWYSALTGVGSALLLVNFVRAWNADSPWTGLAQRAMLLVDWTWVALVCVHLMTA